MSFEMPFHPIWCRPFADRVAREIEVYRRWLDSGELVLLVPNVNPEPLIRVEQERIVAGLVMMLREPGDSIFVARTFWQETPDWVDWPERCGAALGEYALIGEPPVLTREFEHARISVDMAASVDPQRAANAVTIEWRP
jgi:hypothetical protein